MNSHRIYCSGLDPGKFIEDEFKYYLETINSVKQYDTDIEIVQNDNLLTLHTCVSKHPDLREIVICKEISVREYE